MFICGSLKYSTPIKKCRFHRYLWFGLWFDSKLRIARRDFYFGHGWRFVYRWHVERVRSSSRWCSDQVRPSPTRLQIKENINEECLLMVWAWSASKDIPNIPEDTEAVNLFAIFRATLIPWLPVCIGIGLKVDFLDSINWFNPKSTRLEFISLW